MATKLRYQLVFVCFLFAATSAWCRPATVEIFCPWATAERAPLRISITSTLDPEQFPEVRIIVGDIASSEAARMVRFGSHLTVVTIANASAVQTVAAKDGVTISNLTLPPSAYRIVAWTDFITHSKVFEKTFDAASGQNYRFVVEQRTLLAEFVDGALQTQNIPIGTAMLLAGALAAALKERLKKIWDDILTAAGKVGVRSLEERSFVRHYLADLEYNHKYLKLIGLNTAGFSRPLLERVFISLRIASFSRAVVENESDATVPFASAIGRFPCLAILGAPGAGKTTTLSYTLLQFAANRGRAFGIAEPLLPIFVPLRRVSNANVSMLDDLVDRATQIIPDEILDECPAGFFERRMAAGGCILLLDGLDEVVSETHHRLVAQKINNLVAKYPKNRYVVTCRIAGWQNLLPGFVVLQTQDLNRDEIHQFIQGWHAAVITDIERSRLRLTEPDEARYEELWRKRRDVVSTAIDAQSRRLINAIDGNQRIQAIATNPMLLSLICLVHLNKHILPRGRSLLYRECVELLTDAWDRSRDLVAPDELTYTQKETALRQIALAFQQSGKGELPRAEIERVAESVARSLGGTISGPAFIDTLERRSGLLVERSIDVLGFSHLTLQEYLVARHIQQNPELVELITANFDNASWREVILLYCGLVDDATPIVSRIVQEQGDARIYLAAHCIGESQNCDQRLVKIVVDKLTAGIESDVWPEEYRAALVAIAADFIGLPVTHQQHLSVRLIDEIGGSNSAAMYVLADARITSALPALVSALVHGDEHVALSAERAIAQFGNLALGELRDAMYTGQVRDRFARVLARINTSSSARLMVELLPDSAFLLTRVLKNELILDDLLDLDVEDLSAEVRAYLPVASGGWKYKRQPGRGFLAVEELLKRSAYAEWMDIAAMPDPPSVRFSLPAVIDAMRDMTSLPFHLTTLKRLGFEGDATSLPFMQSVAAAVRRNEADLWTTLERARTSAVTADQEESAGSRIMRYVTVGIVTALYGVNIAVIGTLVREEYARPGIFGFVWPVTALAAYIAITLTVLWWRRRRFRNAEFYTSVVCPVPAFLRRLPSLVPATPWAGFAIFSTILVAISTVPMWGYALMNYHRTPEMSELVVFVGGAVTFIGSLAIYYRNVVLKTDVLRQLLMLHPEGRELLRNA